MSAIQRASLIGAVIVGAAAFASSAAAISIVYPNNNSLNDPYFGIVTANGVYYIARQCYNETPGEPRLPQDMGAYGNEVGPGYIFAAASLDYDTPRVWRTKTRDYLDVSANDPRSGGWFRFGIHEARQQPDGYLGSIRELQTGICQAGRSGSTDPGEQGQPFYGAGVSHWGGTVGPYISNGQAVFEITDYLNDGISDVLAVTYKYRIDDAGVRLWTNVRQLCNNGYCASGGRVFVQEPKFVASDYAYSATDNTDLAYNYLLGVSVRPSGNYGYACSDNGFNSWWVTGPDADAVNSSKQCDWYIPGNPAGPQPGDYPSGTTFGDSVARWQYRQQIWFKYANYGTIAGDCRPRACTNILAKGASSADPSASTNYWTNTGLGLDAWGVAEATQPKPSYGSQKASCSTSYGTTDLRDKRRWEILRWGHNKSPDGTDSDQVDFHGWEGGPNIVDCQNLYRAMGSSTANYANYFYLTFQ
jgi:hypothetical protein